MKLPSTNYNWAVKGLAQRDIYAPLKVAGAEAQAAGAWAGAARAESGAAGQQANAARAVGRVYEQIGGMVTKAAMDIQQESFETEAQNAYVNSITQINELENKLYTKQTIDMKDPMMGGVPYDDSYQVVDGGKIVTMNTGYAPTHEVGQQVWTTQSRAIMTNFSAGMSRGAQKIYAGKMRDQVISKTQNMGRHVLKMSHANKVETVNNSISQSDRAGDTAGSIKMAIDSFEKGIFDQKQLNSHILNSRQQGDLLRYNQKLSITEDDVSLSKLSSFALFGESFMTTAQKVQASNAALTKIRQNRVEARQNMVDGRDNNTMEAIISHYKGEMSIVDLNENPEKYGRSNFVPLFDRFTKPVPVVSDQTAIRSFGEEIVGIPFNPRDPEEQYREIRSEMANSVKRGDITVDDFTKFNDIIDKQSKAPFNRQPYAEAKKSLFVDMLGTLDASTMEEISNAGVNIDGMMLKKMGQSANVSQLTIRAFEDLNAYVRQYGQMADPVKWWKDNKKSYQTSTDGASTLFQAKFPSDTVTLTNGKTDITATENNITRAHKNGEYGPYGSNRALIEYSERASTLRGVDEWGFNE